MFICILNTAKVKLVGLINTELIHLTKKDRAMKTVVQLIFKQT
jgi:hypothetical protein